MSPLHCLAILLACVSLTVSMPALAQKPSRDAMRDGWTMEQSSLLVGNFNVFMSAKGVKLVNRKKGISLICTTPYTEVTLYSDNTQQYFTGPFSQFRCPVSRTLTVVNGGLLADVPLMQKKRQCI